MRGLLLLLGSWMNMMKDKREYAHDVVHVVEVLNLWVGLKPNSFPDEFEFL